MKTTLRKAQKYGISQSEIEDFALEYGYKLVEVEHIKRNANLHIPTHDLLHVSDGTVCIESLICPTCNEKAIAWGWIDGEVYYSSCDCKVIDTDEL